MNAESRKINYNIQHSNIEENDIQEIVSLLEFDVEEVVINMLNVTECSNYFFLLLKQYKDRITLVNTDSKILSLLYITGFDKFIRVFEDEVSLADERHELINRRFAVVQVLSAYLLYNDFEQEKCS